MGGQASTRTGGCELLSFFCSSSRVEFEEEVGMLLSTLILMLTDSDAGTLKAAWDALGSVTRSVGKPNLPHHLKTVRDAVATARETERRRSKVRAPRSHGEGRGG